jgi:histidine triad (HIT) family protein
MMFDGNYDHNNAFARILLGKTPSINVYEDPRTLAFMDERPRSDGHVLVISKVSTARNILEIEPTALKDLIVVVQMIAGAIRTSLRPDGLIIRQLNGRHAGQSIEHLHFHVIPRWKGRLLNSRGTSKNADPVQLRRLAREIARAVSAAARVPL